MKLPFYLLILWSTIFSLSHPCIARGGLWSSVSSGFNTSEGARHARHLFEDHQTQSQTSTLDRTRGYMTNSDLEMAIKDFGRRCSNISRIYSIGKSVNGVPLWVVEISDKPGEEEAEPAFKYIGNVHGDEPVGRELLMFLANWLCDNYLKDPLATLIVENIHLHVLPSLNPDGFSLRKRNNVNDIDLNRDFPDQFFPINENEDARQPETRAVMNWLREIKFTASATLHGGALVANYPWDGTLDKRTNYYGFNLTTTCLQAPNFLGESQMGQLGTPYMEACKTGTTSMLAAAELPVLWKYNKMSMLNLVASLVKTGGINYTVTAGKRFGNYHRLLVPRKRYEVIASMPGYKSKNTSIWLDEGLMTVDFILDPEVAVKGAVLLNIYDCNCSKKCRHDFVEFLWGAHLEVYLVLILILGFLCFLQRRIRGNYSVRIKRTVV
ncbi:hypothetical protein K1719_016310 [Acacia pycnantha]|nr:hypothetical protein K1719_016310 [Acacia pycnantha]